MKIYIVPFDDNKSLQSFPNIYINLASYLSDELWLLFLYICLIALFPK